MVHRRLAAFAAALVLGLPAAAWAKPAVWVVKDADSTIVLFGSVHLLPKDLDWRPPALTQALAKADDIWFEVPMDDASRLEAARVAMAQGLLPKGESLSRLLSRRDAARLKRVAKSLHVPLKDLDRLQPWLADVTLAAAQIAQYGGRTNEGVERSLDRDAPPAAQRRAFETPAGQIALFAGAPRSAQIAGLSDTLRAIEEEPKAFETIVRMWVEGDVEGLSREAVLPLKAVSPTLYRALIQRRNAAWTRKIAERLAGSGETVIVVGAGHLVGPDSVPALLRARGITVEGP
jgi:uncharacterized protein YbaP (TraB family)